MSIHILGYGFQLDHPDIVNLCKNHSNRRLNRNNAILKLLKKHGMPISTEELLEACSEAKEHLPRSIGRPHIALAMMRKGYVKSIQEAFKKFLGEGKNCYSQGAAFSVEETISAIHRAHGIAVIAHPHLIHDKAILDDLLQMPFDGIECYYGKFNKTEHLGWLDIAKAKEWLVTGGSDFHGELIKPKLTLGCSWIGKDEFEAIQNHLLNM